MSDHLERLHAIPCVVCVHLGLPHCWPVHAHHLESVRDHLSDYAAVPLCESHHTELHRKSRRGFEMAYKLSELDLMKLTLKLLEKNGHLR